MFYQIVANQLNSYLHTAEIFPRKAVFRSFFKFIMEENPIKPPFPGLIFHGGFNAVRLNFEKNSKKFRKFQKN